MAWVPAAHARPPVKQHGRRRCRKHRAMMSSEVNRERGAPPGLHPAPGHRLSGPGLDAETAVEGRRRDPRTGAGTPGDTSQLSVAHLCHPHGRRHDPLTEDATEAARGSGTCPGPQGGCVPTLGQTSRCAPPAAPASPGQVPAAIPQAAVTRSLWGTLSPQDPLTHPQALLTGVHTHWE